ncbi:hypothetical protein Taro_003533 [Colocasia esculenta]|uniref:Uncharacterized protein n=1 Tax=Colocasia esculenta TaxID=4460 RepID=A0A843TNZ1_COLES|nr:hypothetical protein [Colocasia esculenta]
MFDSLWCALVVAQFWLWFPGGVVLVGLHSCLTYSRGAAVGPFVRDCETERHVCLLCSGFVPVKCGTVEVCVVFLDTLTPVFELYVRLRERRQAVTFSLIGNVWTKTSVGEGEANIREVPEDPQVQEEEAAVREEELSTPERRIDDTAPEHIEPIGQSTEEIVPRTVPAPTIVEEVIAEGVAHFEGELEDIHIEETPNVSEVETTLKDSLEDTVAEVVAPGHTEDVQMIDALAQGEPEVQEEPEIQREPTSSAPAHHGSRKKKIHVHIKSVIDRLNAHGEILCSLQSDVTSIFLSQSTGAKEIGVVKTKLQEMRNKLGSLKQIVTDLSDFVRVHLSAPAPPAPTQFVPQVSSGPSGSVEPVAGPSGPFVEESGPPGPSAEEVGPSGPFVKESGPCVGEDLSVGPSGPSKPVESVAEPTGPQGSVEETPAPSSPPTSFTTPPAPKTFKKPLPKHISSPTPFPAASSSSPISSSSIPPTTSEAPPASSSSAGPSSARPSSQPSPTSSFGSLHPPTPPSFITIIPEAASVIPHSVYDIKDEFEEAILYTVLAVSAHIHRTDSQPSSSPASKKRKTSSTLVFPSNQTLFPPLWYSLFVVNRRRTLYAEYLQKCTFAATFGLPYLNLSKHLNIILPTSDLPKTEQAKILSSVESKTEDQWAKANKALYRKFEVARSNIFPPKDHPLTLLEWFVCQHRDS